MTPKTAKKSLAEMESDDGRSDSSVWEGHEREPISSLALEDRPDLLDRHGPIFILGCPRSGTTFLSNCVGSLDAVELFVGVLAPPRMMHLVGYRASRGEQPELMLSVMRDIFWQSFWRRCFFRSERVAQVILRRRNWSEIFWRRNLDDLKFCYDEPFLCFAIPEVAKHFPNSQFIHIVRDGRDNADSMERTYPQALSDAVLSDGRLANCKNSEIGMFRHFDRRFVPWWISRGQEDDFLGLSQYGRLLWMWKEMVTRAADTGRSIESKRYLEVKYEDFVTSPNSVGKRITEFLELTPNRRFFASLRNARVSSVGISQKRQPERKIQEANSVAGETLARFGYEL